PGAPPFPYTTLFRSPGELGLRLPWHADHPGRMQRPSVGGETVDGDAVLNADRGLPGRGGAGDVDVIAAFGESGGQTFGELGGTIDFGGVCLCRDEDAAGVSGTVRGQDSALLGVGHGTACVPALGFSILDIGMISRQYNDAG